MFVHKIHPRFNDTDALGHINNASVVTWYEDARREIFKIFIPDLDVKKWNLILARVEVDYLAQGHFNKEVEIKTYFEKIGNSSINIVQESWQDGVMIAKGKTIMVHFNYEENKAKKIPDKIRDQLLKHLQDT